MPLKRMLLVRVIRMPHGITQEETDMKRLVLTAMLISALLGALIPGTVLAAAPGNDNFANATAIDPSALPFTENVNTQEATTEPGEAACYGSIHRTVWYTFTAATTSYVRVVATGAYSTVVGVYRVDGPGFGGLTTLSCPAFQFPTGAVVGVTTGTTYKIQIGQYFDDGGTITGVRVSEVLPPANDAFAAASNVSTIPFVESAVEIIAASTEPGEPSSCLGQGTPRTVWYQYTPATSGSITVYADGPGNASITAFTGNQLDHLTALSCQYNRATFRVDAGLTYHFQIDGVAFNTIQSWTIRVEQTPAVQISIGLSPSDPSTFDNVTIYGQIYDPVNQGVASETWQFGDGSSGTGQAPTHRYAADGDYQVHVDLTTNDGRMASADQTIHVRTHDIAITKFAVPTSAGTGQTRSITVGISNRRYPEQASVTLYKITPAGAVQIGTSTQSVPVRAGNRTTDFAFSYTFTADDAQIGKVSFQAFASLSNTRDALPGDNQAQSLPTRVNR
jgi:hypothetical protein